MQKKIIHYLSTLLFCITFFAPIYIHADVQYSDHSKLNIQNHQKIDTQKVLIEYFYQIGCDECRKVETFIFPQLEQNLKNKYDLQRYDTGIADNYIKLVTYQEKLNNHSNESANIVLNGKIFIAGFNQIDAELLEQVKLLQLHNIEVIDIDESLIKSRAEKFTLATIVLAGLVDGLNPCVFATLIFFMSLLAVSHISGKKLLLIGSVYCVACFLTYFALGFGLFRVFQLFSGYSTLQKAIEYVMFLMLLLFAFISFKDAYKFKKTQNPQSITLQLPNKIKKAIHSIMRRGLKNRYLIPGAFLIGFLVTILESVCSGQVYIPTLVIMTKEAGATSHYFWYLLLYNLMFIVPLIVLFLAAWRGVSTPRFIEWSKNNVVWSKTLLGAFFLLLSIFTILIIRGVI